MNSWVCTNKRERRVQAGVSVGRRGGNLAAAVGTKWREERGEREREAPAGKRGDKGGIK